MAACVVPFRGGCPHRDQARTWVADRLCRVAPVFFADAPPGPWIKSLAVQRALADVDADIVVVHDSDVWTDGLSEAVEAVERGALWAIPHLRVHRLTEQATQAVLGGAPHRLQPVERSPYMGARGGGIVVAKREAMLDVPMDPRYEGWGQEDTSWGHALNCLLGPPWRGSVDLWHLWHPPPERVDRKWGSQESWALYHRYLRASKNPEAMKILMEEARESFNTLEHPGHDPSLLNV